MQSKILDNTGNLLYLRIRNNYAETRSITRYVTRYYILNIVLLREFTHNNG